MKCDNPISIRLKAEMSAKHGINSVPVPCGKCLQCKKRRVSQWSVRLLKELEISSGSYFITLTYDPLHVPLSENKFMTLVKNSQQDEEIRKREFPEDEKYIDRSLQAFFKRLRYYESQYKIIFDRQIKKIEKKKPLKYYACGEYGTLNKRPHFHILLFNLTNVQSIRDAWCFGNIDIDSDVNSNNIAYCLKYIEKKDWNKMHKNDDRQKEFSLMSKGLGRSFITPQVESFYNQRLDINYVINDKGMKIPMPKYYRDKMMTDETKEDAIGYIKRNIDEQQKKEQDFADKHGINLEAKRVREIYARQQLMNNFSQRNID